MRIYFSLVAFLVAANLNIHAQGTGLFGDSRYYKIDSHNRLLFQLAKTYRFPDFEEGLVVFKNGEQFEAKLNYNVGLAELHYINEQNDTLRLDYPERISYAEVNESKFYFVDGKFLQTIETKAGITLAYNQQINTIYSKSYVAYANFNKSTEYIVDIPHLLNEDQQKLSFNGDGFSGTTYITKYFYLADKNGHFIKANKNNLLKYFQEKSSLISQYIQDNEINFNKQADIVKVLSYAESLK